MARNGSWKATILVLHPLPIQTGSQKDAGWSVANTASEIAQDVMTRRNERHRKMVFAKRHAKNLGKDEPLTPEELAKAILDLRRKYPKEFPPTK
jgi:hypothetical protein